MTKDLMGYSEGFRELSKIPLIKANRKNGTIMGLKAVDGYYLVNGVIVRQIREYDVKSEDEAIERARADGLSRGIMVETYLSEPQSFVPFKFSNIFKN